MNRIIIIGPGGAGKSTLAAQIHKKTGLPLIHLDAHYWHPNWTESEASVWEAKVRELIKADRWVMDGNYGGTMDMRIERADTIIFLNRSRWICIFRVLKRTWKFYGTDRPSMGKNCPERFSWQFILYLYNYPQTRTPKILRKLQKVQSEKAVHILTNDQMVRDFLTQLRKAEK
ncbi:MAG: DNA topology modulation protein [Bacteroidota bacterium]